MQSTQPMKRFAMSRRGVAALVIAGHVAIIYIIATSLGFVEAPKFAEPMQTVIIDTPQTTVEKPPTPKVELAEPQLDVPIPETPIEVPVEEPPVRVGEEGTVTVRVLVDERGRAGEVRLAKSSGYSRLDEAAIAAIRKWTFAPAMRGAQSVPAWTTVRVTFQLNS